MSVELKHRTGAKDAGFVVGCCVINMSQRSIQLYQFPDAVDLLALESVALAETAKV